MLTHSEPVRIPLVRIPLAYQVIDGGSGFNGSGRGQQVGKDYGPSMGGRARARAEALNQAYGSHRYSVRTVWGIDLGL